MQVGLQAIPSNCRTWACHSLCCRRLCRSPCFSHWGQKCQPLQEQLRLQRSPCGSFGQGMRFMYIYYIYYIHQSIVLWYTHWLTKPWPNQRTNDKRLGRSQRLDPGTCKPRAFKSTLCFGHTTSIAGRFNTTSVQPPPAT